MRDVLGRRTQNVAIIQSEWRTCIGVFNLPGNFRHICNVNYTIIQLHITVSVQFSQNHVTFPHAVLKGLKTTELATSKILSEPAEIEDARSRRKTSATESVSE